MQISPVFAALRSVRGPILNRQAGICIKPLLPTHTYLHTYLGAKMHFLHVGLETCRSAVAQEAKALLQFSIRT
jgi:hypothetical protein